MKFKIDENLPMEFAVLLHAAQYDAVTTMTQGLKGEGDPVVIDVCRREERILVTLDLGFGDIQAYPPQDLPGLIVLRVHRQDKHHLIEVFRRAIPLMGQEPLEHRLWIIEETRVRVRGEEAT
ncbi:MAG: DUF5615 family PIN-like protein [Acidobacteria bacterium]|nr:DUF5615 family PIN-like protein [Acidobacteriota bacterium]